MNEIIIWVLAGLSLGEPISLLWLVNSKNDAETRLCELSDRLWQATRSRTGNEEILADLARRISSVERRLVGSNRRIDELLKRKRGHVK